MCGSDKIYCNIRSCRIVVKKRGRLTTKYIPHVYNDDYDLDGCGGGGTGRRFLGKDYLRAAGGNEKGGLLEERWKCTFCHLLSFLCQTRVSSH